MSYCKRKKISYQDTYEMEYDYKEVLDTSVYTLFHDLND